MSAKFEVNLIITGIQAHAMQKSSSLNYNEKNYI